MALRRGENPKLPPEQEEALLLALRNQREQVAHAKLQAEAYVVACKLGDMDIAKVAQEAKPLATKDVKNFGSAQSSAVAAITLNAVLLSASRAVKEEAGGGKGGKGRGGYKKEAKPGGKKEVKPKIGAKIERLPPPTFDAARNAINENKETLAKVSNFENGQLALLRAFESWLLIEHHEPVVGDAPLILQVFADSCLVDKESFIQYWAAVQHRRESEEAELLMAQANNKEVTADHTDSLEKLKTAEKDMADALTRVKWAAAEVQNARCGNQPDEQEAAREKAAATNNSKALAYKLQQTKILESCRKRQSTSARAKEEADRSLTDKTKNMVPLELMHKHTRSFFEPSAAGDLPKQPVLALPSDSQTVAGT